MNKKIIRNVQQVSINQGVGKSVTLYAGPTFKLVSGEGDSVSVLTSRGILIYKTDENGAQTFYDDRFRSQVEAISEGKFVVSDR